jgi:hypothetical protein
MAFKLAKGGDFIESGPVVFGARSPHLAKTSAKKL